MRQTFKTRLAASVALVALVGGGLAVAAASPASADKIPDGATSFYIMGGRVAFGTGAAPIDLPLAHPDRAPECADGIDNENGTTHNGVIGTVPRPYENIKDGVIDFGSDTNCLTAGDNSELIHRTTRNPDPAPLCGAEGFSSGIPCSTVTAGVGNDAKKIPASGTNNNDPSSAGEREFSAITFGDGNGTTGQAKVRNRATGGTVTGSAVAVPQANIAFGNGYQFQGQCQNDSTAGIICLDLYVQFRISPQGAVAGTTNANGSGTVNLPIKLELWISSSYSSRVYNFIGLRTPSSARCVSSANIALAMTTETSGALTGIRYNSNSKNFKVVQAGATVPAFTQQAQSGSLVANLCNEVGTSIGLPDTTSDFELVISTEANTTAAGGTSTGTGMGAFPGIQPPVSKTQSGVNGGALSASSSNNGVINVNEGSVVELDNGTSYDPALRNVLDVANWTNTFARTSGATPVAVKASGTNRKFVAPDAPNGGTSTVFTSSVGAYLGPIAVGSPGEQRESDTSTVTINIANVAPTANAGRDQTATGGSTVTLKGSASDPGDSGPDLTYCWTQTAGTTVVLPACQNGSAPSFVAPNSTGALTFQLVVSDNDGGVSVPDSVTVNTVVSASGTISGRIFNQGTLAAIPGAKADLFDSTNTYLTTAIADGSGNYAFAGLAGVDYSVRLRAPGYETRYYDGRSARDSAAANRALLAPPFSVADGALRATGGNGIIAGNVGLANVNAVIYDLNDNVVDKAKSDGGGNYSVPLLTPGQYKVAFNAASILPEVYNDTVKLSQATIVTVNSAATTTANATLTPTASAGSIGGTIGVTPAATAPRAYRVSDGSFAGAGASAGAGAAFSIPNLPAGSYTVWFTNSGGTVGEWYNNLPGFAGDGTQLIADPVTVTASTATPLGTVNL